MKILSKCGAVFLLATVVSGCAGTGAGGGSAAGIDVNRTHLGQPIARAQIAIEPINPALTNNAEFRVFATAVERELTRNGYSVVPMGRTSEQVARVDVRHGSHSALTAGWPMPSGPARPGAGDAEATLLDVRIQRRSDGTAFWQGRAVADTPAGTDAMAMVDRLATALFQDFPGESGRTIRVR